jgi:hypothetical protein
MRPVRSEDTVQFRQELAHLVKQLRAIRRAPLPRQEMAEQIGQALSQAGNLGGYVTFTRPPSDPVSGAVRVDHGKLDAVRERSRATTSDPMHHAGA